eukprot:m.276975 g.276975  ORF g.276975 m.276975 type:complete len:221 (-) comp85538_c0_seq1:72-734(-)
MDSHTLHHGGNWGNCVFCWWRTFMAPLVGYLHMPQGMASCRGHTYVRVNDQGQVTRMQWIFDNNHVSEQLGVPNFVPVDTFDVAFPSQAAALETVKHVFNIINLSLEEKTAGFPRFSTMLSDDIEFYVDQGGDVKHVGRTAIQDYMTATWFQTKEWHLGCPQVVGSGNTVMFTATAHGIMADNCRLIIPFQGYYVLNHASKSRSLSMSGEAEIIWIAATK